MPANVELPDESIVNLVLPTDPSDDEPTNLKEPAVDESAPQNLISDKAELSWLIFILLAPCVTF